MQREILLLWFSWGPLKERWVGRYSYVKDMVRDSGSNKTPYSYAKSMKSDSSGVASLKEEGVTYSEAHDKAAISTSNFRPSTPDKILIVFHNSAQASPKQHLPCMSVKNELGRF